MKVLFSTAGSMSGFNNRKKATSPCSVGGGGFSCSKTDLKFKGREDALKIIQEAQKKLNPELVFNKASLLEAVQAAKEIAAVATECPYEAIKALEDFLTHRVRSLLVWESSSGIKKEMGDAFKQTITSAIKREIENDKLPPYGKRNGAEDLIIEKKPFFENAEWTFGENVLGNFVRALNFYGCFFTKNMS